MTESEAQQLHALISGRVQGVGFRYFVKQSVGEKPITGWVRNLFDGRVEVLAEGGKEDLNYLLRKLNEGPGVGYVEDIREHWGTASGQFDDFQVLASAVHPTR